MNENTIRDISLGLEDLALGYRILASHGHLETTLGHLSWRDPKGRGIWIKCQEVGLDEVQPTDLHLVDWEGKVRDGSNGHHHSEWPIHAAVYNGRSDVESVGHTHPMHCVLFSATAEKLVGVGHNGSYFGDTVNIFDKTLSLVRSMEDANAMAEDLGQSWAVLLRNHGVTFCGNSVPHCVLIGIAIEKACKEQLQMNGSGFDWKGKVSAGVANEAKMYPRMIKNIWQYYVRKLTKLEG